MIHFFDSKIDSALCGAEGGELTLSQGIVDCPACLGKMFGAGRGTSICRIRPRAETMADHKFSPWQFIKANQFFKAYAPTVIKYANKMRGKDGHNKPIDFSEADKAAIRSGLDRLAAQLKNALLGLLIALCVVSCSKDLPTPEQTEAAPARPDTVHVVITGD